MSLTGQPHIDDVLDRLCNEGCRAVNLYIARLERGDEDPAWAGLNENERRILLHELRAIMAVYGGSCRFE